MDVFMLNIGLALLNLLIGLVHYDRKNYKLAMFTFFAAGFSFCVAFSSF